MEAAGAVMLLLEAATPEAANAIRAVTSIPLIGCGAGPDCDGQTPRLVTSVTEKGHT